jgi:hypothetical protein
LGVIIGQFEIRKLDFGWQVEADPLGLNSRLFFDMEDALQTLNEMVAKGIFEKYAIAGAIGAAYYIAPTFTEDLDVLIPVAIKDGLVDLGPISSFMKMRGFPPEDVGYRVKNWLVQFVPVKNALAAEALTQSRAVFFGNIPTRVLTAEHLSAIMLETGRPKDLVRLVSFWESPALNKQLFRDILVRHGLLDQWLLFAKKFGSSENELTV